MNTDLAAATSLRNACRERHAEDVAALARGRERLASTQAALDAIAQEDAEAIERHAHRLEQATREGKTGPVPQLVPSDRHLSGELTARRTHQAAQSMIASLEQAVAASTAELTRADEAVTRAVHARLASEALSMAQEIERLDTAATRLREKLVALEQSSELGRTIIAGSAAVMTAMQPPAPFSDPRYVNELLLHGGPHRTRIAAAQDDWRRKIAELTENGSGESALASTERAA